jgi:hypothetical protein
MVETQQDLQSWAQTAKPNGGFCWLTKNDVARIDWRAAIPESPLSGGKVARGLDTTS